MRERIIAVFARVFETDTNIYQQDYPKWDSLRHLNLVVELEEEFNISFEPEEIAELKSLKSIEDMIALKI